MGKDRNHRGSGEVDKGAFVRLPHEIMRSTAYRSLTNNARALLLELMFIYNGKNNGELYLSVRDAADRIGLCDGKGASPVFGELMEMGFIDMVEEGSFSSLPDKLSKARCWRLTWVGVKGRAPTFDYREAEVRGKHPQRRATNGRLALDRFNAKKNRGVNFTTTNAVPVVKFTTDTVNCSSLEADTVVKSTTGNAQKRPIPVDADCSNYHYTSSVATTGAPAKPTGTPQSKLQIAGGPISAGDVDRLRDDLRSFVSGSGYGAQKLICEASSVAPSVVSRFRSGKSLPAGAFVPLRLALVKLTGERKAA